MVFPAFGKISHERKRLIETTAQQRNKIKTSPMSVASTLYTCGDFVAPDHCHSVFFA